MGLSTVLVWDKKASSEEWIGVPHFEQNWESSDISDWHLGHSIA
jgi:hypothetical protein